MIRVLIVLSAIILLWFIVYPTIKDGKIYYGSGDPKKDNRKELSFSVIWKTIVSKFKRK